MLDNSKDPVTGKPISKFLVESWWRIILGYNNSGEKNFEILYRRAYKNE